MSSKLKEPKQQYEGGATRSVLAENYSLIPHSAMRALAGRLTLGAAKHGRNNWREGSQEFREACINHLMHHLLDYIERGNASDDNTGAIICNAAFLCHFEAILPYQGNQEDK